MTIYNTTTSGYNSGFSQATTTGSTQTQAVTTTPTRTNAEIQQAFVLASKAERVRLKEWFTTIGVTEYEFTADDGYDSVDGFFLWGNKQFVIEAKNRKITVGQYPTHPIEETKWKALNYWRNEGWHPLLIIFASDGAVLYNLKPRMEAPDSGLTFVVDSKFPQTTVGQSNASCTRKMADIRKDIETMKDRVYTYKPQPIIPTTPIQ